VDYVVVEEIGLIDVGVECGVLCCCWPPAFGNGMMPRKVECDGLKEGGYFSD
jgi:hypothetical protein